MSTTPALKQLRNLRLLALIGLLSVVLLFGAALAIFILSVSKVITLHIAVGIVLLVGALIGMYVGLFTAIGIMVAISKQRVFKFFVTATPKLSGFSLNPFIIMAGRRVKRVANAMIAAYHIPVIDHRAIRREIYKRLDSKETHID